KANHGLLPRSDATFNGFRQHCSITLPRGAHLNIIQQQGLVMIRGTLHAIPVGTITENGSGRSVRPRNQRASCFENVRFAPTTRPDKQNKLGLICTEQNRLFNGTNVRWKQRKVVKTVMIRHKPKRIFTRIFTRNSVHIACHLRIYSDDWPNFLHGLWKK
ncbi:MAG: hypothetical protein ABL962_05745, partial [Fimbriimonadaceae bacterium]